METLGSPTKPAYSGSDSHSEQKTTNMHLTDKCGSHRGLQWCHMTGLFDSSAGYITDSRSDGRWPALSFQRGNYLYAHKRTWRMHDPSRYLILSYFNIIVLLMLHSYNGVKLGYTFYDQKEVKLLPHCRKLHKLSFWYYAVVKTCKKVFKTSPKSGRLAAQVACWRSCVPLCRCQ